MKNYITAIAILTSISFFGQEISTQSQEVRQNDLYFGVSQTSFNFGTNNTIGAKFGAWSGSNSVYDYNAAGIVFNRWLGSNTTYSNAYIGQAYGASGLGLSFDVSIEGTKNSKPTTRMFISPYGNIGIGTDNPLKKLHIVNNQSFEAGIFESPNSNGSNLRFIDDTGKAIEMGIQNGNAVIRTNSLIRLIAKTDSGNVGIGTENPDSKLTVKGKIHCEEVQVDLDVPADYVFEKYYTGVSELKATYTMPTLEEIEAYTKENHHLPSIPSAATIKEEGLQLKEMTNLLLQKIEELTLYTIEQEKRIKALEFQITTQK